MNEEWVLMNFQEFLKKLLIGEILIQNQINVVNIRRDTSCQVSFLNHLLSYQNINRENILEMLTEIYHSFYELLNQLKDVDPVHKMIERINNEWYETDNFIVLNYPIPNDYFDKKKENEVLYHKSYQASEEILNLSKIENNIPLQVEKDHSHPLKKYFNHTLIIYEQSIRSLDEHLIETERIIQHFKEENINFLLDLSIKHKQLYLKLADVDSIEEIPENIHLIFSNYIHIHNLVLKQLIQYYHTLKSRKIKLNEGFTKIKIMKQNIENIAYIEDKNTNKEEEDERIVFNEINKDFYYKNLNEHIDTFF